ncbi:uncharacterized protein LOC107359365 isoform X2 [Tetranychus urticae]|uniref:uncharacterized protein LOC107359365 isoform X2 n=1 Tax=Tetranychus urticae TaxID=32264 RepID=UPI00077BC90E|nr:uncharacterized protein LOC107359365 isoform X2 [Tetranychus urticae]
MFINELPDDCLLIIFDSLNELGDLLNCYEVCSKWRYLIAERTRKVKYFVEHRDDWSGETFPSHLIDHVYYGSREPIDATCFSTLFPNLTIADFRNIRGKVNYEDLVGIIQKMKSLKGLTLTYFKDNGYIFRDVESAFKYCGELEMVGACSIEPWILKNGPNIKQLCIMSYDSYVFVRDGHNFPNLERIHIGHESEEIEHHQYKGLIFRRLKILELYLESYYGFQFIDSCPNLQSAYIQLMTPNFFVDESIKHESLQDLVISCGFDDIDFYGNAMLDWNDLKRLFMKYPNLKHLALCNKLSLKNEHVEQLVRIFPNLVLLDVRGYSDVTQEASVYVEDYSKLHGRSIAFNRNDSHWPPFKSKWEPVVHGFDFMKHCFYKAFQKLPTFLVSSDY